MVWGEETQAHFCGNALFLWLHWWNHRSIGSKICFASFVIPARMLHDLSVGCNLCCFLVFGSQLHLDEGFKLSSWGSKFTENKRYWHTCKVKCADGSNNCPLLQVNGSLLFVCLQTFLVWYIILLLSMQKCHCHANSWSSNKMPVQNAWRQWLFSYFFFPFYLIEVFSPRYKLLTLILIYL